MSAITITSPLLIIGRQGQLAQGLARMAAARGLAHIALGRPELDLTSRVSVEAALSAHGPVLVINAAAYTAVDKAESEPEAAFALNRDGPGFLAQACAARGIRLIHLSTDQVFDGTRLGGYRETDMTRPLCLYGRSKLEGEMAVLSADRSALIVRVSWVFGPDGNNFVTKVLSWAKARPELSIVCDQIGRPTYAPALAEALIDLGQMMLAGGEKAPGGVVHLAGADVMTRADQARLVLAGSQARGGPFAQVKDILTRDFPTPATRPLNAELDIGLARTRYGISLGGFAQALDATLDRLFQPVQR
jgi:dTDP-4-dehydrorhamnose reductase